MATLVSMDENDQIDAFTHEVSLTIARFQSEFDLHDYTIVGALTMMAQDMRDGVVMFLPEEGSDDVESA